MPGGFSGPESVDAAGSIVATRRPGLPSRLNHHAAAMPVVRGASTRREVTAQVRSATRALISSRADREDLFAPTVLARLEHPGSDSIMTNLMVQLDAVHTLKGMAPEVLARQAARVVALSMHADWEVRSAAGQVLRKIAPEVQAQHVDAVVAQLADADSNLRKAADEAMQHMAPGVQAQHAAAVATQLTARIAHGLAADPTAAHEVTLSGLPDRMQRIARLAMSMPAPATAMDLTTSERDRDEAGHRELLRAWRLFSGPPSRASAYRYLRRALLTRQMNPPRVTLNTLFISLRKRERLRAACQPRLGARGAENRARLPGLPRSA